MGIIKIKQVICDWCNCAIDYLDVSLSNKEIKDIVKKNGAIVKRNGNIFCCKQCSKNMDKQDKAVKKYLKEKGIDEYGNKIV